MRTRLVLGAALLLPLVAGLPSPATLGVGASAPRLTADGLQCKPQGPIALDLRARSRPDGQLDLFWSLQPQAPFTQLTWELLLPADATWTGGRLAGEASGEPGAATQGSAVVQLPALPHGELHFVARGLLAEAGSLVEVARSLAWGRPGPPVPVHVLPGSADRAPLVAAEVPSAHHSGR